MSGDIIYRGSRAAVTDIFRLRKGGGVRSIRSIGSLLRLCRFFFQLLGLFNIGGDAACFGFKDIGKIDAFRFLNIGCRVIRRGCVGEAAEVAVGHVETVFFAQIKIIIVVHGKTSFHSGIRVFAAPIVLGIETGVAASRLRLRKKQMTAQK